MDFVMPVDRVVPSVKGHAIEFKKDVPTFVPPVCYREVIAAGGVPQEALPEGDTQSKRAPPDMTDEDRSEKISEAMMTLVAREQRGDFGANGAPIVAKVQELVGFDISAKERDEVWTQLKQSGVVDG